MSVNGSEMDLRGAPSLDTPTSRPVLDVAARERELDQQYPNRPRNKNKSLPFHTLLEDLFNPLLKNLKTPSGARSRRQIGPDHGPAPGSHEMRRSIIDRYISRWRHQVGPDFFPAMRLIIPEKDRDRAMYGLKEKNLGKYLVKIMKIDKNSEDGFNLLNWKVPGKTSISAGDFAGRCHEVLQKRPFREKYGDMTIQEVNDQLDRLSAELKEDNQLPILAEFYRRMNADEMTWLIRIMLRQNKIGATEKTILGVFHPDAEVLFNVSSSLRRVCWDLYDEHIRLETDSRGVTVMQCYQPQLAHYDGNDFPRMVEYLRKYATDEDKEFWIEEKLDGERIQLHMQRDDSVKGSFIFKFFSRKAKDYTYLYGESLYDANSALTQHLKEAFADGVDNIILDGEMITWDPELDRQAAFGTLKTAAISEQNNPYAAKQRPLYRVFDILLLNDKLLTQYTLRDRREALKAAIKPVHRRFEIHEHSTAVDADEIDTFLRQVIETASEGLVLKNPRSLYTLAERPKDWLKVKPEYMQNYGESLDCLVIGGYFGSGRRGGFLSSFLCGLRADKHSTRFLSFFKVGGGMAAADYAAIHHHTDGKWMDYNVKKPPSEYVTLAGPTHAPKERPDQWIKPEDSVVVEVKAASVSTSDEFATKVTLRFPRFKKIRQDRDWSNSLTVDEFLNLKTQVEEKEFEAKNKFEAEQSRSKRRAVANRKKPLKVIGYGLTATTTGEDDNIQSDSTALLSAVFHGLTFYVVTDSLHPIKKTKPELEALIKRHGGQIVQTNHVRTPEKRKSAKRAKMTEVDDDEEDTQGLEPIVFSIADRRNVKVASLEKSKDTLLIRPRWIFDSISQAKSDFARGLAERVVLFEPDRHLFFTPSDQKGKYDRNVDRYGDPLYRETSVEELHGILNGMEDMKPVDLDKDSRLLETVNKVMTEDDDTNRPGEMKGWLFKSHVLYFDRPDQAHRSTSTDALDTDLNTTLARTIARFAGAKLVDSAEDPGITQIIASPSSDLRGIRKDVARRGSKKVPHVVTPQWILESWKESTVLDAERFVAR